MNNPPQPLSDHICAGRITPAGMASRSRMARVDARLVESLARRLPAQTPECVMRTLGISVNTWVKLRKGEAIRESVALRFVQQVNSTPE